MFSPLRLQLHHPPLRLRPPPTMNSISSSSSSSSSSNPSTPPPTKTVKVVIKGRVQGVFFRDWTVENARELGLHGWVRNRRDISVEALFSGQPDAVSEMVDRRCRVGPPSAVVTAVNSLPPDEADAAEEPGQGFRRKPTV